MRDGIEGGIEREGETRAGKKRARGEWAARHTYEAWKHVRPTKSMFKRLSIVNGREMIVQIVDIHMF